MNVRIPEGARNLARHCHDELRVYGHQVALFARYRPEEAASPWTTDASVVGGDLTSRDDCWRADETARAEAIVPLGAIPDPSEGPAAHDAAAAAAQPPILVDPTFRVNTRGTSLLFAAARSVGTKVVALAATASVLLAPRSLRSWLRDLRRGPPPGRRLQAAPLGRRVRESALLGGGPTAWRSRQPLPASPTPSTWRPIEPFRTSTAPSSPATTPSFARQPSRWDRTT